MEKHNKKTRKLTKAAGYLLVLTALIVGGLHWYAKAYVRYQITRMAKIVTLLAVNIQSAYLSQPNYGTLTTEEAIQQQFFPPKVLYADTSPYHLQNGRIEVFSVCHPFLQPYLQNVRIFGDPRLGKQQILRIGCNGNLCPTGS